MELDSGRTEQHQLTKSSGADGARLNSYGSTLRGVYAARRGCSKCRTFSVGKTSASIERRASSVK
jgi:hypothetical protein